MSNSQIDPTPERMAETSSPDVTQGNPTLLSVPSPLDELRAHLARDVETWQRDAAEYVNATNGKLRLFYANTVMPRLAKAKARLAALDGLQSENTQHEDVIEALEAKVKSLAPHGTCGCSYDTPGDLCLHHSPRCAAIEAELRGLREDAERIDWLEVAVPSGEFRDRVNELPRIWPGSVRALIDAARTVPSGPKE